MKINIFSHTRTSPLNSLLNYSQSQTTENLRYSQKNSRKLMKTHEPKHGKSEKLTERENISHDEFMVSKLCFFIYVQLQTIPTVITRSA